MFRFSAAEWDRMYREGRWDYLAKLEQAARNGVLAGWIAQLSDPSNIVDLGCGTGTLLSFLPNRAGATYLGIDHSGAALERARLAWADGPCVDFCEQDVETVDFTQFGAGRIIVFNEVLYCLREPLRPLHQLLSNGALVLFSNTDMEQELSTLIFSVFRGALVEQVRCTDDKRGKGWTLGMLHATS